MMQNNNKLNHLLFHITITSTYQLSCSYQFSNESSKNPIPINEENEYPPIITFYKNEIYSFQHHPNEIDFMKEWIEYPDDFKEYQITYQNKQFNVISEVLFALLIKEIKDILEVEFVIEKVLFELPTENKRARRRIKVALESIGLRGFVINKNHITYDYSHQGEILLELIEMRKNYENVLKKVERAMIHFPEKSNLFDSIKHSDCFDNETLYNLTLSLTTKEKESMKFYSLDNYCIFIASRYFESIEDFINLEFVCKRLRGNMEKFHYNPINLTINNAKYFPNIETQFIYENNYEFITGAKIQQYCSFVPISYEDSLKMNEERKIEFKKIYFTTKDFYLSHMKKKRENTDFNYNFIVPDGVNVINSFCCEDNQLLEQMTLPISIISLGEKAFNNCTQLSSINLPDGITYIGDSCFHNCSSLSNIHLPSTLTYFNNNWFIGCNKLTKLSLSPYIETLPNDAFCKLSIQKLSLPQKIISFEPSWFNQCSNLTCLKLPPFIKECSYYSFYNLTQLKELKTPNNWKLKRDRFIIINEGILSSIDLNCFNKIMINKKKFHKKQLQTFTIPSDITKINDLCFANCQQLSKLKRIENIKEFGKGCFMNCILLKQHYNTIFNSISKHQLSLTENQLNQLETWTDLHFDSILFDTDCDLWENSTILNERIVGKKDLVFLIENEEGEKFGYYSQNEIVLNDYNQNELNFVNDFEKKKRIIQNENCETFEFNLNNKGTMPQPMKYELINKSKETYKLFDSKLHSYSNLITLGDIHLMNKKNNNITLCKQTTDLFNYHTVQFAFGGNEKTGMIYPFKLKRLLVLQMNQ